MKDLKYLHTLMTEGKHDMAKDMLMEFLLSDPQNRDALFNLGMCYCELNNPEKAIGTLTECTKYHPEDADAYVALGYACSLLQQMAQARENFMKALEIDPANSYALQNLGSLYGQEKDYDKAIECYERVFAANPQDQQTAYVIGCACYKAGRLDMAEKYLIAAIDLDRSTMIAEHAMELLRDVV